MDKVIVNRSIASPASGFSCALVSVGRVGSPIAGGKDTLAMQLCDITVVEKDKPDRFGPRTPRMASSKFPPLVSAALFIGAVALVAVLLLVLRSDGFSSLEPFPADTYRSQPSNLLGNEYALSAQIHSLLDWDEGTGRLLAVIPEGSSQRLPVFIPDALGKSIHTGQRYKMQVAIRQGGLIYVEDLEKY